jgi:NAD(P)-dependent dehydrogenase (short-subunit alcohol dehydrogenase family)
MRRLDVDAYVVERAAVAEEKTMQLEGKRVLVTGSSRGIGRGVAIKLAAQGAVVAIHCLHNEEAAKATLGLVREQGSDGLIVQGDVSDPGQTTDLVRAAASGLGGLDVFVSNARPELPAFFAPALDISIEQWDSAMDTQAKAFLVGAREAANHMPDGGRILAITYATGSRTGGLQPWIGMGAAKAALEATIRYLAVALARRRITVNAISPSWTEDSVLNTLPLEAQDLIREWHQGGWTPMGRLATPADVGDVAALLCSAEAAFITGQTLVVDGGASLMNAEVPPQLQLPSS